MKLCTLALLLGISSLYGMNNNGMNNPDPTNNNEPVFSINGVPVNINDLSNRRDIVPYMVRLNAVLDLIEGMLDNADEVPTEIRINIVATNNEESNNNSQPPRER